MRAVTIKKTSKPTTFDISEIQRPGALGPSAVEIAVHTCSLNPRDKGIINADRSWLPQDRLVLLSDAAGVVNRVGRRVRRFKVGDRVLVSFMKSSGSGYRDRGGGCDGVGSEWIVTSQDDLVKIPENLSFGEAAALPCAGGSAWMALTTPVKVKKGEIVLVQGSGAVSLLALQIAKAMGALVIVVGRDDRRLRRARRLGADLALNWKKDRLWKHKIHHVTRGAGVDRVIETTGAPTFPDIMDLLAFKGRIFAIGFSSGQPLVVLNFAALISKQATVSCAGLGTAVDLRALTAFISRHKIRPQIDRTFLFSELGRALKYHNRGEHFGKINLIWNRLDGKRDRAQDRA